MTDERDGHPLEELRRWALAAEKEIEEIRAGIAPLERRLDGTRERLYLIRRLIRLTEGAQSTQHRAAEPSASAPTDGPIAPLAESQDLETHLEQILREAGKPWEETPTHFKRGAVCRPVKVLKPAPFTEGVVERREWQTDMEAPIFTADRAYIETLYRAPETTT